MSVRKTSRGFDRVQADPPEGARLQVVSQNWCDPCTWYTEAIQITDEVLTDSGNGLTYTSSHAHWIDTYHGRLTGETYLDTSNKAIVKVGGVTKTEDTPFGPGGDEDFSIDYATGSVTFHGAPGGRVTATYRHQNGSMWKIAPLSGKVLRVTDVEVQFSSDVVINDSIIFSLYVGGNPYGSPTIYKTMQDFINEACGSFPSIPALGGASRGTQQTIHVFAWPYKERATTDLKSSLEMEIRISLQANKKFGGDAAVATFYGVSENET